MSIKEYKELNNEWRRNPWFVVFYVTHSAVSHLSAAVLGSVATVIVLWLSGSPEKPATTSWTTEITDVDFAGVLRSDQLFSFDMNGPRGTVPTEKGKKDYQGPEITMRTNEGAVIRIDLLSKDRTPLLWGLAFMSRDDLIQEDDIDSKVVLMVPPNNKVPSDLEGYFAVSRDMLVPGGGVVHMPGQRILAAPIKLTLKAKVP